MISSDWAPPRRLFRRLVLASLIPFALVVIARWGEPPSAADGDYAQYLLHAKALVESRPYSDIGYIYTEMNLVGPRVQPPGWPLFLAPFVAAFGTHWPGFKLLVSLLVAAFGATAGMYIARREGQVAGIVVAATVPITLASQAATGSALSDPLFCVLIWLTLLVADADTPTGWRRGVVLTLMTLAALSVRVAGVALIPALLLHAFLNRKENWKKAVAPIAGLMAVAGVIGYVGFDDIPFLRMAIRRLSSLSLTESWYTYKHAVAAGALYPFGSLFANDVYHALVAFPLIAGAVLFVRKESRSVLACFGLAYLAVLLLSPVRDPRYAWPLIPVVMMWIVSGTWWLGKRFLPASAHPAIPRFIVAFVAAITIGAAVQLVRMPMRPSLLDDPDTAELFNWVRGTRDSTDLRIVFTNPRVLTLETEVPAMGIPYGDVAAVISELGRQRITHVVVPIRLPTRPERILAKTVTERPAHFSQVFANATHEVHRFVPHPQRSADSGSVSPLPPQ